MTDEQVAAAKDRAAAVVNGMCRVREQQARDALALAGHAEALAHANRRLQAAYEALHAEVQAAKAKAPPWPYGSTFKDVFGGL
jgi:hypothetical protein